MIIKYETKPKPKAETLFDKIVNADQPQKIETAVACALTFEPENIQEALTALTECFDNMVSQLFKEMLKSND